MEAIFLFTKNRPDTLNKTLVSISTSLLPIYIIDDSTTHNHQSEVLDICNNFKNCNYLGKLAFEKFLSTYKISLDKYKFLLGNLGSQYWNLGFARNFALLFA